MKPVQQQMGAHPQQYGNPQQFAYSVNMDPWFHVQNMTKPQIKEQIRMLEVVLDIDAANKYDVYDDSGSKIFFAKETTGCLARNCIPPDCRPFALNMSMQQFPGMPTPSPFLSVDKKCQWTCFCLNRPLMTVNDGQGTKLGEILNPFNCCDMNFLVKDQSGSDVLRVHGSCCQPGFFCQCPCGACKEVHFEIEDVKTKENVGHITRQIPNCLKCLFSEADNYSVEFGKVTDTKWKAMLLATALFIDFRYFTQNKK